MKNYNKLIQLRVDKSFNYILIITSFICFLASVFLFVAELPIIYGVINLTTGIILLVFFVMADSIKTSYKIIAMVIITSVIAIASFMGGSFSSAFLTLLLLGNVISVLFLERYKSMIISILSILLMFGLAYYSIVYHGFTGDIEPMITWALQIAAFILFIIILHISVITMKSYLIENIEGIEIAMEKTKELAYYDQLTKLPNVFMFKKLVKHSIEENKKSGFVVIFSLKSLNLINSTLGYEVGDQTLIESTELLQNLVGENIILARTGGNEFVVWIEGISAESCYIKFSGILQELQMQSSVLRKKLDFHSVFTKFEYGRQTFDDCYQKAILTLTYAKHNNVLGLLSYNDELEEEFRRKEKIKDMIEDAMYKGEITLHYQGKYDLRSQNIIGVEALARWSNDELGRISPVEFIPIIESMNLAVEFGQFVIKRVCHDFKAIQDKYQNDVCVSINISPSHIMNPEIINSLRSAVYEYSIPTKHLTVEITEDIIIKGIDEVKPILSELRDIGLRISLDDFGTGYSSLNYLSQLELDEIKIDKSFIDQIEESGRIHILIENIIHLSKQLNLTVIAEGVETQEQSDVLEQLGCYVIQGYYYSMPEKL